MDASITRKFRTFFFASITAVIAIGLVSLQNGDAAERISWRTGPEFRTELNNPTGISWDGQVDVRRALARYAEHHRVAIMLDRRIDPNSKILCAKKTQLEVALKAIAQQLDAGICFIEPIIYIGPKNTTADLGTLIALRKDELRALDDAAKRRLIRSHTSQWEALAVPRELVEQISTEIGLKIAGAEHIPHDLWPAASLPPLGAIDRLSLILAGFDLAFKFSADGQSLNIIKMPAELAIERTYSVPREQTRVVRILAGRFPKAEIRPQGVKIVVVASAEDHQAIRKQLAGESPRPPTPRVTTTKLYELKIEKNDGKEVGAVLRFLARELEMEVEFDESANSKLKDLTYFSVKAATVEEVLKAVVKPVGLSFKIDGKSISVFAPK